MGTIYILWLRQLKRYFRSRSRMIGSLGQPLLYLVAFGFGFGAIFKRAGEGNYLQFLSPGVIAMSVLFISMFTGIELIWDRQFGFLKETLVAPVPRYQIMLGRTLGGATIGTMQGIIVLIISVIVGFRPDSLALIPVSLIFMFLISLVFTSFGTAIATVLTDMQGFQLIMNFVIMPTFFLSGALYPQNGLPVWLSIISRLNPLSYGVDGLRGALNNASHFGMFQDFFVLVLLSFVLLSIGSYLFEKIQS